MVYIFLIALLIAATAIGLGLVVVCKKLPGSLRLFLLAPILVVPFAACKVYERNFMLSVVPDALHVASVSYSQEESWGFGPGGNEAGIRVYPLPEKVADEIRQRGIEFFHHLPPNQHQQSREWRGIYETWSETPIAPGQRWSANGTTGTFLIHDYICAYGFCIDIKPEVVEEANAIVNSEGSYYAYGRIGLIVVSPKKKRVVYMYNG